MTREGFCHISFCKFIDFRKKDFFMEQEPIARTALDEMVESDQDQMLKAMIPYLPSSGQRFLSVYTKVRELRNTMSLFQSSRRTADLQATGFSGTDPLEMLQDIRKCCGGENRRQIDHITSLMATIQMLQIMNEDSSGGENPRVMTGKIIPGFPEWTLRSFPCFRVWQIRDWGKIRPNFCLLSWAQLLKEKMRA